MTDFDELQEIKTRLGSEESDERLWAVYDLENFPPEETVDLLVSAMEDDHRAVREAASEVLGSVPPELSTAKLVPLLGSPRIKVRNITAALLTRYGDAAVEKLIEALEDGNEDVRKFAADILGLNGSELSVEGLCKASLDDPVENVSVSAIEALGKIASPKALPTLYKIIEEKKVMVLESIEAIGLIGSAESVPFLVKHLKNDDIMVTFSVIDALGNIGSRNTIQPLIELLKENNAILEEPICRAILKIGERNKINVFNDYADVLLEPALNSFSDEANAEYDDLIAFQLNLNPSRTVLKSFFDHSHKLPSALLVTMINQVKGEASLLEKIKETTKHYDDWVSYTAIEALSAYSPEEAAPILIELLENGRETTVVATIKTVVKLTLKEAKPKLESLTRAENEDIRAVASDAIKLL
jgi:HEAT repeat protein